MNPNQMKNMIVLKNIPSNIVEEAIIILKNNKKIKSLERIEKQKSMPYLSFVKVYFFEPMKTKYITKWA